MANTSEDVPDDEFRIKLAMYERRIGIYEEVREIFGTALNNHKIADLIAFKKATEEAGSLFGEDIPTYINEIFDRGVKYCTGREAYDRGGMGQPALDEMHAHERWLADQVPIAKEKFKKYIDADI